MVKYTVFRDKFGRDCIIQDKLTNNTYKFTYGLRTYEGAFGMYFKVSDSDKSQDFCPPYNTIMFVAENSFGIVIYSKMFSFDTPMNCGMQIRVSMKPGINLHSTFEVNFKKRIRKIKTGV